MRTEFTLFDGHLPLHVGHRVATACLRGGATRKVDGRGALPAHERAGGVHAQVADVVQQLLRVGERPSVTDADDAPQLLAASLVTRSA